MLDARQAALQALLERLGGLRERSGTERWGGLVTSGLIRRAEAELAWLAELRTVAADPGDGGGRDGGGRGNAGPAGGGRPAQSPGPASRG